ncbi:MAG: PEP-CTERM sorting domain-containing protein, partial [Thermoguttaceae bacterium]|nr:PEP-CTERM sorting domain-containing protein [Thermoguttaceae bacterium]
FGSGDRWIGFTDSNATSTLDGKKMPGGGSSSNNFQWITGEPVTYTAWGGGEPNNGGSGEDAAIIRGDGLWNDLPAGSSLGQSDYKLTQYIIEFPVQLDGGWRLLPKLGPVKPDGTRNAYEMILNPSTWVAAKVDAQNRQYMGVQGHLVTITSAAEDTFVRTLGNGWIGLTDDPAHAPGAFEGGDQSTWPSPPQGQTPQYGQKGWGWAWVTGEPLTYHNWNGGEPNNYDNWEHYAEMTPGWNDLPNTAQSWAMRNYVVEYDINWQAQPAFQARMVQIGAGGADTQLNSAGEALSVALGFGVGAAAGNRYQVITTASHQPLEINYGSGSAGSFPLDNPYPNGQVDPGDDFTVRVTSKLYIPEGEWTIGFAGDDGGYLHLDGIQFINQINTNNDWKVNDGTLIWQDQTAHGPTMGHFVVPRGGITTTLDAMTFERVGGQHFEIFIAPGHWPNFNSQAFALLTDGQYGWRASPIPPQNGFNVVMLQLDPSNPSGFDNEINDTQEAISLVFNVSGPGDYNIGGRAYRVSKFIVTQSPYVDFGGGGYFNEPTLLYPDGTSDAGEDFLVGVRTYIRMPPGTWTIGFASDDGGVLQLINTHGSPIQFSQEFNTNGDSGLDNTLFYNGTRGHDPTWGVFTLTSEAYLELQGLFFERAGGDSYEIFLAKGAFTSFNTTDFFILRNGVFPGLLVAPELWMVVPEPSSLLLLALGGLCLAALARHRRKTQLG